MVTETCRRAEMISDGAEEVELCCDRPTHGPSEMHATIRTLDARAEDIVIWWWTASVEDGVFRAERTGAPITGLT